MQINFQTYPTIKPTLAPLLHTRRDSHQEQHLNSLALMICGSVGAQHLQFAQIADHAPLRGRKNESMITRFRRWVKHDPITPEAVWLRFAPALLQGLAHAPLTILLDRTSAGRGCVVLIASVVYHGRARELLWSVVKGKKGHLPQALHCDLIRRLQQLIPTQTEVVLLGDGAFDRTALQATMPAANWHSVCRTATNILISAHARVFTLGDLPLPRGEAVAVAEVEMTAKRSGPLMLLGLWHAKDAEPLYLISSSSDAALALERYRLRFRIECMFANHKSRALHIHKSQLAKPARLARLLIATSLAYLWVHALAIFAEEHGWVEQFHRKDRSDLSLFQIGVRAMRYAVREGWRIPVSFRLPSGLAPLLQEANGFSVR